VPLTGGTPVKLNDPLALGGHVGDFQISPDNSWVVYNADQDTDEVFELYSVPLTGGSPVKLNGPLVSGGNIESFRVSPGSSRVVYRADQDMDEVFELYVSHYGPESTYLPVVLKN
jgi:Tol biopolymer transport system component